MADKIFRAVGIDFGTVRIGVAVSDDLGMLAHPHETVAGENQPEAIARLAEIVKERKAQTVVLGLPLNMDGSEGPAVKKVRKFIELLRKALPEKIEIVEEDERLTTVAASEKLSEAGKSDKNQRDSIDQAAAVEILQGYLDYREPSEDEMEDDMQLGGGSSLNDDLDIFYDDETYG
ncbi:MAG: Holliday junction resolvase RuvX [Verrucomicrobiales bacterium]|nr:Holliday junction resolvase RuvX [Verrucomicrobiales bacterium]